MPIFETFFKRQQKLRGKIPDVYTYDQIPEALRVQIVLVMHETLGGIDEYHDSLNGPAIRNAYKIIVETLRKEIGVFTLPPDANRYVDRYLDEITNYILHEPDVEHVLSALELVCRVIENEASRYHYRRRKSSESIARNAIAEINARLREHGVGYEYDREIIRIDAELIHSNAVKPALTLLRNAQFTGAEEEFLSAYKHYQRGENKEALSDALKAFESTMKSIYDKRKWPYGKTATASGLVRIAFDHGLVPDFWANHFSGLRATLEAGVPTARNRLSGHGQGVLQTKVLPHLVAYALHMTASTIVFLVKADESLQ